MRKQAINPTPRLLRKVQQWKTLSTPSLLPIISNTIVRTRLPTLSHHCTSTSFQPCSSSSSFSTLNHKVDGSSIRQHHQQRHTPIYTTIIYRTNHQTFQLPRGIPLLHPRCSISTATSPNLDDDTFKEGGEEIHDLYRKQMLELNRERSELFGSDDVDVERDVNFLNSNNGKDSSSDGPLKHPKTNNPEFEEQLREWNEERDALYNFSKEETSAWSKAARSTDLPTHGPAFMEALEKAREAQARYEEEMEKERKMETERLVQKAGREYRGETRMDTDADFMDETTGDDNNKNVTAENQYFTHLTSQGRDVSMVDVGQKTVTRRLARARSVVVFPPEVMEAFGLVEQRQRERKIGGESESDNGEIVGPKGPIFATARLAGIMGAKRTSDLIPLCHPLPLDKVHIDIVLEGNRAIVECECRVTHKTGVEMEALAGASIAALTIYDMVKAVSHKVRIEGTELIGKTGGKKDVFKQ